MLLATIIGTRPQLIKIAPVSKEIKKCNHKEILINTGQHYDYEMDEIFFKQLKMSKPDYNLEVGSGLHGAQTAIMITEIEKVLMRGEPDFVIIYGDTNSTLAAAIATSKLNIPFGHVEAGVRNFNMSTPEEINRIVADRLASLQFAPTLTATNNLIAEGLGITAKFTGDVMYDTFLQNEKKVEKSDILTRLNLKKKEYILATIHRPYNSGGDRFIRIMRALNKQKTILPLHPRTKDESGHLIDKYFTDNITVIKPQGYFEFSKLLKYARKVVTDSGGVQKEAYWAGTPCITVSDSTPWKETLRSGWNVLVEPEKIDEFINTPQPYQPRAHHWGDGNASANIINIINMFLLQKAVL